MSQDNSDRVITGEVIRPSGPSDSSSGSADEDGYQQTYLHKVASARPGSAPPSASPSASSSASPSAEDPTMTTPAEAPDAEAPATEAVRNAEPGPDMATEAATEPGGTPAEATAPVPSARRPGDEAIPAEMAGKLLTEGAEISEQWMRVQAAFVDDPRIAVTEAANLIDDVVVRLQAAVRERQRALRGRWDGDGQADTESLRVTMRQYRALVERIAAL